ncbi:hypothetical protein DRN34_01800 [Thermococci archaeon]|nr:MAG: hypothetical protein DRN34_01800 [Thermococci archaeon]
MVRCKIVSIAESLSDVDKNDTKLHLDAELRQKALDDALHELSDTRVVGITVDRDKYTVNYTIIFEE